MSRNYSKLPPKNEQRYHRNQSSHKSGYFVLFILVIIGITSYFLFSRGMFSSKNRIDIASPTKEKETPSQPAKPRFEFYTLLSQETVPVPHDKTATTDHPVTADATTNTDTDEVTQKNNSEKNDVEDGETIEKAASQANAAPETAPTGVPSVPVQSKNKHPSPPTPAAVMARKVTTTNTLPTVTTNVTNTPKPAPSNRYILQVAALQHINDVEQLKAKLSFLGFDVSTEPFQRNNTTWYRIKVGPFLSQEDLQKAQQTLANNHLSGIVITLPSSK